jgi:CHASE3 domain sensor protein
MRKFLTLPFLITQLPVLIALLGIALMNWTYSRGLSETRDAVAHSLRVNDAISLVLSQLQDIEVGQRGYLLTRDIVYLEPYEGAQVAVADTMARLRALVADSAVQSAHLGQMDVLVGDKLAEIDTTLRLAQTGHEIEALAEVKSNRGKAIMDALRNTVAGMRDYEKTLLDTRTDAMRKTEGRAFLMVIAGLVLTIAGRIVSVMVSARLASKTATAKRAK